MNFYCYTYIKQLTSSIDLLSKLWCIIIEVSNNDSKCCGVTQSASYVQQNNYQLLVATHIKPCSLRLSLDSHKLLERSSSLVTLSVTLQLVYCSQSTEFFKLTTPEGSSECVSTENGCGLTIIKHEINIITYTATTEISNLFLHQDHAQL